MKTRRKAPTAPMDENTFRQKMGDFFIQNGCSDEDRKTMELFPAYLEAVRSKDATKAQEIAADVLEDFE